MTLKTANKKKVDMKSDWSDSDDGKDNQARNKPIRHNITSDWEKETECQETIVEAPLRRLCQRY